MQMMLASPAEVGGVYTGYFIVDRGDGKVRGQIVPTERGDIFSTLLAGNCIGGTSSMLLRRSCFDNMVGLFDERLASFQDYDLWLRLARHYRFEYVREPLLKYFVHGNKIWTNVEALNSGLDLMLKKYGYAASFRKKCSLYYLSIGVQHCETNQAAAGRKALLRAARLNPSGLKAYYYLLLALLGGEAFNGARRARAHLRLRWQNRRAASEMVENA
jgi:hypothetical protein